MRPARLSTEKYVARIAEGTLGWAIPCAMGFQIAGGSARKTTSPTTSGCTNAAIVAITTPWNAIAPSRLAATPTRRASRGATRAAMAANPSVTAVTRPDASGVEASPPSDGRSSSSRYGWMNM